MSAKISGQVWDLELSASRRLVLLAMADHADHLGNNVYPSVGLIAWKTGYSEVQTRRIIKSLIEDGLLVIEARPSGRPTRYSVRTEAGTFKAPFVAERHRPSQNDRPIKMIDTPIIAMTPESSLTNANTKNTDSVFVLSESLSIPVPKPTTSFARSAKGIVRDENDQDETRSPDESLAISSRIGTTPNPLVATNPLPAKRPRDLMYDAIVDVFQLPATAGGMIGNIKAMLLGTAQKGEWKLCALEIPATHDEVRKFGAWWKQVYPGLNIPMQPFKLQRHFEDFRSGKAIERNDAPQIGHQSQRNSEPPKYQKYVPPPMPEDYVDPARMTPNQRERHNLWVHEMIRNHGDIDAAWAKVDSILPAEQSHDA